MKLGFKQNADTGEASIIIGDKEERLKTLRFSNQDPVIIAETETEFIVVDLRRSTGTKD